MPKLISRIPSAVLYADKRNGCGIISDLKQLMTGILLCAKKDVSGNHSPLGCDAELLTRSFLHCPPGKMAVAEHYILKAHFHEGYGYFIIKSRYGSY
jgi:hypothetical protein